MKHNTSLFYYSTGIMVQNLIQSVYLSYTKVHFYVSILHCLPIYFPLVIYRLHTRVYLFRNTSLVGLSTSRSTALIVPSQFGLSTSYQTLVFIVYLFHTSHFGVSTSYQTLVFIVYLFHTSHFGLSTPCQTLAFSVYLSIPHQPFRSIYFIPDSGIQCLSISYQTLAVSVYLFHTRLWHSVSIYLFHTNLIRSI